MLSVRKSFDQSLGRIRGFFAALVALLLLVACGGGGGSAGVPVLGGGSGSALSVADLVVTLDKTSMPNDGSAAITATVTTMDANRVALGNAPVTFRLVDSGDAFVIAADTKTDAKTGQVTASVRLGSVRVNRSISIVVVSGTAQQTVSFGVVDPVVSSSKQAKEIAMVLDRASVSNSGSEAVTATVTAIDGLRNVMPNIPVTFTADQGGIVTVLNAVTDSKGQAKAEVRIGSDKTNRLITVSAKNEMLSATGSFVVVGTRIQATLLPTTPMVGAQGKVDYRVIDVNQQGMSGVDIKISGLGLPSVAGKTDIQGVYSYSYTAPVTAGSYILTAQAGGVTNEQTIAVASGQATVPDAVGDPSPPALTASPSVVKANTTDKSNGSDLRAVFVDRLTNKAIKNMRVLFTLPDPNSVGGEISTGDQILYTDSEGVAISKFIAGTRASPTDGVVVRACYSVSGTPTKTNCPTYADVRLTVVSDPLSVSVGTNDLIEDGANKLTYVKRYVVLVVDSAGNPKSDVQVNALVDLDQYLKGFWVPGRPWTQTVTATCAAEDKNRNGIIDPGEDVNSNGQLDPRKSDVAVSLEGATKTDVNGQAVVRLEYPQSFGSWIHFSLNVTAAGVVSPPGRFTGILPVAAKAIEDPAKAPPFALSPFGRSALCTDGL